MLSAWSQRPVAPAVEDVAVLGVGDHGVALACLAGGFPVAEIQRALPAPGGHAHAAGILLRAVEPVGKPVVGATW